MKFSIFLLAMLALSIGCSSKLSQQEIIFDKLSNAFVSQMAIEEGMRAYGTGGSLTGGPDRNKTSKFFFAFEYPKLVDITEARSITLRIAKKFLEKINNDEEIRPYLEHYPYRHSGIELTIGFFPHEKNNPSTADKYVHVVFFYNDVVVYQQYDHQTDKDVTILRESYQDALNRNAASKLLK